MEACTAPFGFSAAIDGIRRKRRLMGRSRFLRRLNGAMQTLNWRVTLGGARQAPPRSQLPQERRRLLPQYAPGAEEPEQHGQQ